MSTITRVLSSTACLAIATTLTAALTTTSAAAEDPPWTVVAEGLDNPRQLSFDDGVLYVAEAGVGGSGPCMTGPEGDEVCFGKSGAVTRISHRGQRRVLTGLPSLAATDGSASIGPTDVLVDREKYTISIGLGADPAARNQLPRSARKLMGTVLTGKFGHHWPRVLADLARHEQIKDPDGAGPDSNPVGLAVQDRAKGHRHHRHGRGHHWRHGHGGDALVAVDAGANALLRISASGRVSTLAVFDSPGNAPLPFPPFDEIPMQAVPTSVAQGPDGAWYVSELTGFPFAPGAARIHRVTKSGHSSVWATGLTNVTDLAWHHGKLYAIQLSDAGLINEEGLPMGSLVRVMPGGGAETIVGSLPAPYGLAFQKGKAYVTTCSVCPDGGSVVRIGLN